VLTLFCCLALASTCFAHGKLVPGSAKDVRLQELPWQFIPGMSSLTILVTNKTNKFMKFVGALVIIYINGQPVASEKIIASDIPPFGQDSMTATFFMNHSTFDSHKVILQFVDF